MHSLRPTCMRKKVRINRRRWFDSLQSNCSRIALETSTEAGGRLWGATGFGSFGQNPGVVHHDFSSQIDRGHNREGRVVEWDDVVHVNSHQPTTWATHWNSHSQDMSQSVDILETIHLDTHTSVNVRLSLHGHRY